MNTKRKSILRFLVLLIPCGFLLTGAAIAGKSNVEYEIVCAPNDGTTKRGKYADEPLKQDTRTGRITRIYDPTKRAIAKLACDNAQKLESCCQQPVSCEDQCNVELEQCLQSGQDPVLCFEAIDACFQSCQAPVSCEEQCNVELVQCLESGQDPGTCFETLNACFQSCQAPVSCEDQCNVELEQCISSGQDPGLCFETLFACFENCPPPDPCIVQCDEEWIQCVASGQDPVLCYDERNACGQSCQ